MVQPLITKALREKIQTLDRNYAENGPWRENYGSPLSTLLAREQFPPPLGVPSMKGFVFFSIYEYLGTR